ncbi:UNVERIFIED_ORG: hypothetical protein OKW15_003865 [Pseudomonas reinekei]|nr:hypothetical protein [Pseudomonas reinekei]
MEVNDDAGSLTPRGALRFFVGTPPGASSLLQSPPPSAIHGRVAHCAGPALGLTRGRVPQQRPRRPTGRPVCWLGSARFRSADRPPSRASSLPQKSKGRSAYIFALHHSSGRALARLPLLILIHPPPRKAERRCSSGGRRAAPFDEVEHIERRSSRSRPEAMRPDEYRSEGTPSLGEGPYVRGERFLLTFLGACKKVSRRKGETISRRYRSNGYVHDQQETGRLTDRHREQARSHSKSVHPQNSGRLTHNKKVPRSLDRSTS